MNVVRNNIIKINQAGTANFTVVQEAVQLEEVGGCHELQDVGGLHAELLGGALVEVLHHLKYCRSLVRSPARFTGPPVTVSNIS